MKQDRKSPVTLEELLRLKRAERPAPEFWGQFDRELRTKQLAALVEQKPWWRQLPRTLAGITRYRFPLGATAVLALSLAALRDNRPAVDFPALVVPEIPGQVAALSMGATNVEEHVPSLAEATMLPAYTVREPSLAAVEDAAVEADYASGLEQRVSLLGGVTDSGIPDGIAANLAAAQAAEPVIARSLLGASRGFETRALPPKSRAVDPLAQMTPPSEARRARIQSAMALMSALEAPARTGSRIISQISDDRLYDQPHRLKGSGDRLSIKF